MTDRAAAAAARLRARGPLGPAAREALADLVEVLGDEDERVPAVVRHALVHAVHALTPSQGAGDAAARRRARKAAEAEIVERGELRNVRKLPGVSRTDQAPG